MNLIRFAGIALLLGLFGGRIAAAQDDPPNVDVVYLKDGTVFWGTIVEQSPDVVLRTYDGKYLRFTRDQIARIVKAGADQDSTTSAVARRKPPKAQPFLPVGSLFLPGLGQYVQHRPAAGVAFTGAGLAGLLMFVEGDTTGLTSGALPFDGAQRRAFLGAQLYQTAGELSAYDTFRHSAERLRAFGRYRFLTRHESVGRLLTAPFDPMFLKRWTTWVGLAYTGALALVVANDPNRINRSLTSGDVAFGSAVSLNAGIGEEAFFRGWLYPALYQAFDEKFLPANALQSTLFGALHPDAEWFMVAIAGWAFYQGWLTRRNGWSVRESIFQHVWYDVVVILVDLGDARQVTLGATLPLPAF